MKIRMMRHATVLLVTGQEVDPESSTSRLDAIPAVEWLIIRGFTIAAIECAEDGALVL